jgi:predicted phage terminase large subunit-like protein
MTDIKEAPVFQPASEIQLSFLQNKSDFVIYGGGAGSGKTYLALMYCLMFKDDPNFKAVFIRQTSTQLTQAGGLWQEAQDMYCKHFGATSKQHPSLMITFPSGAQIQFKVSSGPKDTKNFDGGQYSLVIFDEAQWHTQEEVSYLESRIRSKAKGPHRLICTCNPLRSSFLYNFVYAYLDPVTGIPKPEMSGVVRYYAQYNGSYIFGDTREEITEKYGDKVKPQTYCFIAANIYSNPVLIKRDPNYLNRLENLKRVERERLLLGSWHAQEENAGYFKRDWCQIVDRPPLPHEKAQCVRAWDFAATLSTESNRDPDYTAGVKMSRDKFGVYYIEDVYRFRKLVDGVLKEVADCAVEDGLEECQVTIPRDSGAGGKTANAFFIRTLAENGIAAKSIQISGHTGKIQRFLPFAALAEAGFVRVVRGEWNAEFFDELEAFNGGRKGHDDMVDACADAFNTIAKSLQIPTFVLPNMSKTSIVSQMR